MKTNRQLIDMFLQEKLLSAAPKTYLYYKENLQRFYDYSNRHYFSIQGGQDPEEIPYAELPKELYMEYLLSLKNSGIKNTSLATYHRAVRTFCNWMHDNALIEKPFTDVKLPRSDAAPIVPLTAAEVRKLDEIIARTEYTDRNYLIFHFMLDCGLRRQEVISLRWEDVHIGETDYLCIKYSKYNKSRMVPVPVFLAERLSCLPHNSGYVLKTAGKEKLTVSSVKDFFRKLKKHSGIGRLHPHLLRHTFATSFISGGGNMEYLRLYLGHADYAITQQYLHISFQSQICGMDIYKLDKIFFKNYNNT